MPLSDRDRQRIDGVHPDLVAVIEAASGGAITFMVTEGIRSVERQKKLVAAGASRTMNSMHLVQPDGYGHAVDLAVVIDGTLHWDWPAYRFLASQVKAASSELDIPIRWGGDWTNFRDGPHFQLAPEHA